MVDLSEIIAISMIVTVAFYIAFIAMYSIITGFLTGIVRIDRYELDNLTYNWIIVYLTLIALSVGLYFNYLSGTKVYSSPDFVGLVIGYLFGLMFSTHIFLITVRPKPNYD